jgi:hypothetical protein
MTNSISFRFLLAPKRSALATILVLTAFVFGCGATARPDDRAVTVVGARADDRDGGVVRVMTQNLFQGTNFSEILSATTPPEFLMAVTTTRQNILATKPAERAAAVAARSHVSVPTWSRCRRRPS